ncbi:MAG: hypothetical protein J5881_05315 [Clostridia bacterium]|nr:hypothetical protein [Clostridia bacterium]
MEENSTNTTTETKTSWFKSHMTVCIISAVVVIAVVVALVFILGNNGGKSPEEVVKTYVAAMQEGNSDKIMSITDVKGVCAWEKCGRDASKFEETYKSISDDEAKKYESTAKSGLDTAMGLLKSFGGVEMSINNIEKPEELATNLFKVNANVKMKVSVFGIEQEQDQNMSLVVYNGRFIGEAK